jgi:hypothetical protein
MQRTLPTWCGCGGWVRRLIALAGFVALSLPPAAAADWSSRRPW